jgi:NAD(P)-dependent dehydrogenase (short-subunit alcohol dehydrogenase family)
MKCFHGKKALVTGAASGIGRAIALALAREGADLYLVDVNDAKLAAVADEARHFGTVVVAARCDVGRPEQITATVNALVNCWGYIDILVNNAGVCYYGPTDRMTAAQWDWLLGINLLAPIRLTQELLPILLARDEAHILNVCSICGITALSKLAAYQVSKFGLVGFSQSLRAEYKHRGLGVTALCPGFVHTGLLAATVNGRGPTPIPPPPRWLSTSPEAVAAKAVNGIRRNRGFVLVTPLAYVLWYLERLAPGWREFFRRSYKRPANRPATPAGGPSDPPAVLPGPMTAGLAPPRPPTKQDPGAAPDDRRPAA